MRDKRGKIVFETVIFIVLNLVFFSVMLFFVHSAGSKAMVYEQTYAKQIALLIDNSKPETSILLDMEEALDIAKKNKEDLSDVVSVKGNRIVVNLKKKGGYSYKYYSNYSVSTKLKGNLLSINIQ